MKSYAFSVALAMSLAVTPALAQDKPGEGVTVRPVIQPALEEMMWARIIFRGLEDLGYTVVRPQEVMAQTAHLAVGMGDADFYPSHWHDLHALFYEEAGGDAVMSRVGALIEGTLQGYLVDKASYDAGIQSLSDFSDPAVAAKFDTNGDGKADLAGCVPGWGCERVIEHQLTEFELRDTITHNQGEYNAIIADTIAQYESGEPIFYYTWTPYWVSGVLVPGEDVEWLSVPYTSLPEGMAGQTEHDGKNLGFPIDTNQVIARNEFLDANPAAAKLFEVAKININDVSAQNKLIADGEDSSADIDRHVDEWINANQAQYDDWLAQARAAAE